MSLNVNNQNLKYHFVPANLSINDLNVALTGKPGVGLITHKALNFYTLIVKKLINNILFDDGKSKWVCINHLERRCLLGKDYKETIKLLVNAELLLEDPKWIHFKGGKNNETKKYALPTHLLKGDKVFQQVKISNKTSIQKMIARFNNLRLKNSKHEFWRNKMIHASKRLLLHDNEESRAAVQAHIDKVNSSNRRFKLRLSAKEIVDVFNYSALDQGNIDPFGKRVHTRVTNMAKGIRRFLYFDNRPNEKLGCVDIVNSQPVFMSIATPAIIHQFTPELIEAMPTVAKYHNDPEVLQFKQICGDGSIYEHIMDYFSAKGIKITRDQAKPIAYTCFFGNYIPYELDKLKTEHKKMAYQFLKDEYNGMYRMFREMKLGKWSENNGNRQKDYANNCMLAQRLESSIFFTIIVPAVWDAGYHDITTIHDSIMAPEQDCDAIKQVMMNEFKKLNIKLKLSS
ncbi:hypothetical protein [Rufibacter tibetensis]|uniref:DNA-directed DNA polymerase family A palm domain-containing protein n=1 Tax=Rufibacter tibetensis TaxID=512763 RepID=A0A0P0CAV9_9BACT|nr:hypothetical protein [Rufibacter tibetensis]ALJ00760.1 hypothetical protein DC20_19445 [Rufibacter tibetensis]